MRDKQRQRLKEQRRRKREQEKQAQAERKLRRKRILLGAVAILIPFVQVFVMASPIFKEPDPEPETKPAFMIEHQMKQLSLEQKPEIDLQDIREQGEEIKREREEKEQLEREKAEGRQDTRGDAKRSSEGEESSRETREETREKVEEEPKQEGEKGHSSDMVREPSRSDRGSTFLITMYTAGAESTGKTKGDEGYGITASGAQVSKGRTVACPPRIDFGTRVEIEGLGTYVCEDRGGAVQGDHIDVYTNNLDKALEWGKQYRQVTIHD